MKDCFKTLLTLKLTFNSHCFVVLLCLYLYFFHFFPNTFWEFSLQYKLINNFLVNILEIQDGFKSDEL